MNIILGADHAGFELKRTLKEHIIELGHNVLDIGTDSLEPVDYPDFARIVAEAVADGDADRGVLICGSGVGACIAANKVTGVRAAICHDSYSAHQGVEHDDMNVLVLGARVIGVDPAKEYVQLFLSAHFSEDVRHVRRLNKVRAIEKHYSGR